MIPWFFYVTDVNEFSHKTVLLINIKILKVEVMSDNPCL